MALATLGALVEALAGRPGLENMPAIVIGREEHLDAQLLEGHIQGCAERGDGREEAQAERSSAEVNGNQQRKSIRRVGWIAQLGQGRCDGLQGCFVGRISGVGAPKLPLQSAQHLARDVLPVLHVLPYTVWRDD